MQFMFTNFNVGDEILVNGFWYGVETLPDEDGHFFASNKWGTEFEFKVGDIEGVNCVKQNPPAHPIFFDADEPGDPLDISDVDWGF